MSTPADGRSAHPIAGFATRLHKAIDGLAEVAAWSMTRAEQRDALVELARGQARLDELRLRVLAAADRSDIAADSAATSTGAWVAHATRQPRGQAHRDVTVAQALDGELGATRDALAEGALDSNQARDVVSVVEALSKQAPDAVAADPSIPQRAEKHLIELAAEYDAVALKRLGRHVLEVLDPEAADKALGKRLEAEEAAAARATSPTRGTAIRSELPLKPANPGSGRVRSFWARPSASSSSVSTRPGSPHQAVRTRPSSSPSTTTSCCRVWAPPVSAPASRSRPARPVGSPARPAWSPPSCDAWSTAAPSCSTSAASAACSASTSASASPSSKGCTAEACGRPAAWCHAHHDTAWTRGGRTDLTNGRLLCPYHHGKGALHRLRDDRPPQRTGPLPTGAREGASYPRVGAWFVTLLSVAGTAVSRRVGWASH